MKLIFGIGLFLSLSLLCYAQEIYKESMSLMGSDFEITVVSENEQAGAQYIQIAVDEIKRIEKLISSWDQSSQTSEINRNAGIKPIIVDRELYNLIERSIAISKITDGAFDITYASMDKLWKFDGSMTSLPTPEEVSQSVARVGYEKITLNEDEQSVFLKQPQMKIGFGAIGKGYAADKAKEKLMQLGVKGGIINASGDLTVWGSQPSGKAWQVAITNPMDKNHAFTKLPIMHGAVVTSGNYEKRITLEGKTFTHIIDPRTGYPSQGILSVTIFSEKGELADALATSVFVMGIETGIDRINQLPNVECIIVDDSGKIFTSKNIRINNNEN
ncbi:FAD:protein FMN transferase [Aegicerativicinus sediminis]|uniref:FAD:protein FMN transferase n=1 Tax=Aegicerativicinus sediminis TaxID=2893202 RepID=UPI001E4304BE|nr:FAD:protein FMN transferase [Aegicerativicinus sediminis]